MLTKNQIEILNLFRKNIFLKASILELKNILNKTSYSRIFNAVKELEKNKILKIEKIGHANLVFTDLNARFIIQASYLDEDEAMNSNIPNYDKIINIKELSNYLIIAKKSQEKAILKRGSEQELVIVIPDSYNPMSIQEIAEKSLFLVYPKINISVLKEKEIIEMLIEPQNNLGKEIFKSHIILKNAYKYYELLKEAIKQGFKEK